MTIVSEPVKCIFANCFLLTRYNLILKSGVDAFVNRRRRTISETSAPDRVIVMNGHNHRFNQPAPTVTNSSSVNVENKKLVIFTDKENYSKFMSKIVKLYTRIKNKHHTSLFTFIHC